MKRLVRPWICTSTRCGEPPQPHCRDCSHAIYRGKATLNRTTYRWEHSPQFGPLFSRRAAGECDWIPHGRHPVWICFQRWHDKKFGKANSYGQGAAKPYPEPDCSEWIPRTVHPTYKCPVCGAPAIRNTQPDEWWCDDCQCHPWYWPESMIPNKALSELGR